MYKCFYCQESMKFKGVRKGAVFHAEHISDLYKCPECGHESNEDHEEECITWSVSYTSIPKEVPIRGIAKRLTEWCKF